MTGIIYMDNHATTQVDARVAEVVMRAMTETYGNAGSTSHSLGWAARDAVEDAREVIAAAIGATDREIVFTSGATESNNLALRGVFERHRRKGNHVVTVSTEHKAVLDPVARLARAGVEVTCLSPRQHGNSDAGRIDPQQVADAIRDDTLLVSVMMANNEIGVIQPMGEIAKICKQRGVLLHTDATQAVGKIPVDVVNLDVDLLSFSAHKFYGPKGVGALYVRRRAPHVRLTAQIDGGGQEHGLRSGTLNVPGIVGFAEAIQLCLTEMPEEAVRQSTLRDELYQRLTDDIDDVQLNGPELGQADLRLPNNLNMSFMGVDGEALMLGMKQLAVSSGSACTSVNPEPSHVLRSLGLSEDLTRSSLRFGLGRFNTPEHVEVAAGLVADTVARLRKLGTAK
jgi:cysteine desulfurase